MYFEGWPIYRQRFESTRFGVLDVERLATCHISDISTACLPAGHPKFRLYEDDVRVLYSSGELREAANFEPGSFPHVAYFSR